jgi:hypothetical protein
MQVCRTSLATGYTVTAVKEEMAVVAMWEENRILYIGEGAFGNWTSRSIRIRNF